MKRTGAVLLSGLAVLLLLSIAATAAEEKEWNRPVTPVNPIQVDKPKNWTETAQSECPAECTKNGCCTGAFDQVRGGVGHRQGCWGACRSEADRQGN